MLAMVVNDDDGNLIPPVLSGASRASSLLQVMTCRYISTASRCFDKEVTLRHSARPLIKPIP
ncbi:hypothetical protein D9M68_26360 [compost metagenome]